MLLRATSTSFPVMRTTGDTLPNSLSRTGVISITRKMIIPKLSFSERDPFSRKWMLRPRMVSHSRKGWYTISGMPLNQKPTTKGIYIYSGKKVVIK